MAAVIDKNIEVSELWEETETPSKYLQWDSEVTYNI